VNERLSSSTLDRAQRVANQSDAQPWPGLRVSGDSGAVECRTSRFR
jgi:hypothetical protein